MEKSCIDKVKSLLKEDNWIHTVYNTPYETYYEEEDFCGERIIREFKIINIPEYRKHLINLINDIDNFSKTNGDFIISEYCKYDNSHRIYYDSMDDFWKRKNPIIYNNRRSKENES